MTTQPIVIQSNSQSSGAGKYKINLNANYLLQMLKVERIVKLVIPNILLFSA